MKPCLLRWGVLALALFALGTPAFAHHLPPGFEDVDEFDQARMVSGFLHPFTGLDHLPLALSIGWLAFVSGTRRGGMLAASFVGSLAVGMITGRLGFALPMLEQGLALSVVAGGVLLAYASRRSPSSVLALAALAGLWHGNAHGAEMPAAAASIGHGAALLAGTAAILSAGIGLAALCVRREEPMRRWIGTGVALAGAWLWIA
jgi:urease accessory protein